MRQPPLAPPRLCMIHFSMITARRDIAFHSIEQHDTVIGRIYEEYWYPLLKTSLLPSLQINHQSRINYQSRYGYREDVSTWRMQEDVSDAERFRNKLMLLKFTRCSSIHLRIEGTRRASRNRGRAISLREAAFTAQIAVLTDSR